MRLALYEPDIPQNTGTILRLGACLGVPVDIIEPCGFPISDRALRRAGLDYLEAADLTLHPSWAAFRERTADRRLVLMTTRGAASHLDHRFEREDVLLFGRETTGVPEAVHATADVRLRVPMRADLRSLNVAVTAAIVLGEALRQTGDWPTG